MPTVKEKYGYLPTSVWSLKKGSSLRMLIGEQHGKLPPRRSPDAKYLPGLKQSSFNPDLAKRIIEYWSEVGDTILDPFAGHSTRAQVARLLGRNYIGYEIAPQALEHLKSCLQAGYQTPLMDSLGLVTLHQGDGCVMPELVDESVDMVFSCPPFWNIEKYENVPGELSHCQTYEEFMGRLTACAQRCFAILRSSKFIVWVIADFRSDGFHVLHKDSLGAFETAGFCIWDIVVNVLQSPFAWAQIGKCERHKYTSKIHEYVLVGKKL